MFDVLAKKKKELVQLVQHANEFFCLRVLNDDCHEVLMNKLLTNKDRVLTDQVKSSAQGKSVPVAKS